MDEFEVNNDTVKPYFQGRKKHKNYWQALDFYYHMSFHFDGYFLHLPTGEEMTDNQLQAAENDLNGNPYFARLIDTRRPSESDVIKAYRRSIYLPFSQLPCFKVYNSLRKIVKASDWKIDYSKSDRPSGIADGEYLEDYCEKNFPHFNSVENWAYNYAIKNMLNDANGLIYVMPLEFDIDKSEYYKPIANIIHCKEVLDFKDNEYAVFIIDRKYEYEKNRFGNKMGIITKEGFWEVTPTSATGKFAIEQKMKYEMEYMPAWLIGGVPKKIGKHYTLSQSFLAPMLPGLDAMASESNDSQMDVVQHMYLTMWYFTQQDCRTCMGKGWVQKKGNQLITCSSCNGTGNSPKSPARDLVLKAGSVELQNLPTPPAGYVVKPTEIVTLMAERIKNHEKTALSSINHEFLVDAPLAQSGISKQFDRQELENYTYSVAYHLVENIIDDVYYFINEFRYMNLIKSEEKREKMLPKISIPTKYDLLTESILEQQLQTAKTSKIDQQIIDKMEIDYAQKKFPNDENLVNRLKCIKELDPFPGITVDEKQTMLLAKTVSLEDVILSNYINTFVSRAFIDDEDFYDLEYEKKVEIMMEYVKEKTDAMDKAQKMKDKNAPKQKIGPDGKPMVDPKTGQPIMEGGNAK